MARCDAALERFRPDLIECQDAYNLPWVAIAHRKRHPDTALVASYMTDFPTVYVERPFSKIFGRPIAKAASRICYSYCGTLYRRFDAVLALSENGGATKLRSLGIGEVDVVPLGVEIGDFEPARRDPQLRAKLGLADDEPLLIYVGRLDGEKKPDVAVDAFRKLPRELGAKLVLLGEGPLKAEIEALRDERIVMPGYVQESRRTRPLAGQRRYLCVGNGGRDFRRVHRRSAGVGSAGRRRRSRCNDRSGH